MAKKIEYPVENKNSDMFYADELKNGDVIIPFSSKGILQNTITFGVNLKSWKLLDFDNFIYYLKK